MVNLQCEETKETEALWRRNSSKSEAKTYQLVETQQVLSFFCTIMAYKFLLPCACLLRNAMEYVLIIVHFQDILINIVYLRLQPVLNLSQTKLSENLIGKTHKIKINLKIYMQSRISKSRFIFNHQNVIQKIKPEQGQSQSDTEIALLEKY